MIRKIGLTALCATTLFSNVVFSATEHVFTQAAHFDFLLPANEPQIFTNTFFWTVKSRCTIISDLYDNFFSLKVLRKTGSLNGVHLSKGDSMDVNVHPGDSLFITAVSGGRVELTNHGEKAITARCEGAQ